MRRLCMGWLIRLGVETLSRAVPQGRRSLDVVRLVGLKHFSELLEESEHFCRWRQEKVARSVHYGLPQDSFEGLVPCVPNYCAHEIWKKLSISVVGLSNQLRRLSSVGKHWQRRIGQSLISTEVFKNKTLEKNA